MVEQIEQEETRHLDADFRASYAHELEALKDALKATDPSAINTAKTALDTAWRAQLQDLAKRHQTQLDELNKLLDVVNYDWPIPPEVAAPIAQARTDQLQVRRAIDRDDLPEAVGLRQQIVINLGAETRLDHLLLNVAFAPPSQSQASGSLSREAG